MVAVGTPIIADRRPERGRRRPRRPRRLPPRARWRSTSPTRAPAAVARARAWSAATRPTAARSGAPARRATARASRWVPRPPTCSSRAPFAARRRVRRRVEGADEPAVPASRPASRARAGLRVRRRRATSPSEARALAKPPVRKLAKDLGVDLTSLTPSGAGGTVTPRRCRVRGDAGVSTGSTGVATRPAVASAPGERETPRADQGRAQDDGRRDGAVGVHGAPRHRVDHRRRHRHDGVRRAG